MITNPDASTDTPQISKGCDWLRLIRLTTSEVRRLFNLIGKDDQAIYLGLRWSVWRREHQANARAHHFRRRLRLQAMQI